MKVWPQASLTEVQCVIEKLAPSDGYRNAYRRMEETYLPAVCDWLRAQPRGRLLEVGPGWGTTALWAKANGWSDITLLDVVDRGTWITDELLDMVGGRYIQGDICAGPLDERFDTVVMTMVVGHLKYSPVEALEHVRLMQHGWALISALAEEPHPPAAYGYDWRAVPRYGEATPVADMVVCAYNEDTFAEMVREVWPLARVWRPPGPVVFAEVCYYA